MSQQEEHSKEKYCDYTVIMLFKCTKVTRKVYAEKNNFRGLLLPILNRFPHNKLRNTLVYNKKWQCT